MQIFENPRACEIKIEFVKRKNNDLRAGCIRQLDINSCTTAGVSTSNMKDYSTRQI
jgi:hypothetical protein